MISHDSIYGLTKSQEKSPFFLELVYSGGHEVINNKKWKERIGEIEVGCVKRCDDSTKGIT